MAELTNEEKQKIYLEEKARLEAQERLRKESEIKQEVERKKEEEIREMMSPSRAENIKGNIGALIGAVILIISFLFPWLEAWQKKFYAFKVAKFSAVIIAIICVAAIAFAIIGWYLNQNRMMGIYTAIAGGIASAISIFHTSRLEEIVESEPLIDLNLFNGDGLSICVTGGIILLISGVYMAFQSSEEDLSDLEQYMT
jgi:VIT1/CCC1 family predicted Fe2+/Mn2+ transporter